MSMEHAFLTAMEANPTSRLAPRVKKAVKHHATRTRGRQEAPRSSDFEALAYQYRRLGRAWASFRLGGCSWVGPIENLRARWLDLAGYDAGQGSRGVKPELLWELAGGVGLCQDELDQRGRDYLMRVLGSRDGDDARQCRIEGARWLSPATLLFEAINDLTAHSGEQVQALCECLSANADLRAPDARERLRQVCVASTNWLRSHEARFMV